MNGMPKSGNYLLWSVFKNLLDRKSHFSSYKDSFANSQHCCYEGKIFDSHEFVDNVHLSSRGELIVKAPPKNQSVKNLEVFFKTASIIWTHDCFTEEHFEFWGRHIAEGARYYLVRDPRAVYLSTAHHVVRPEYFQMFPEARIKNVEEIFEREEFALKWSSRWRDHVRAYLEKPDWFNLIRYEDLVENKRSIVSQIASELAMFGLSFGTEDIEKVCALTDFDLMKASSPTHLRKGKTKGWAFEIPAFTQKLIKTVAGPEMRALGYI
ncbi:sulfotransferase domain-containing protein [Marinobacteraceae bacterium S3BR75-40.1]